MLCKSGLVVPLHVSCLTMVFSNALETILMGSWGMEILGPGMMQKMFLMLTLEQAGLSKKSVLEVHMYVSY